MSQFVDNGGLGLISSGLNTIGGIFSGAQANNVASTNLKAVQEQTKAIQAQNEIEKTRLAQLQAAALLPKTTTEEKKPNQLLWWGLGIVGTILSGLVIFFATRKK